VDDCAEAIVMATERYDGPDPVNVGSGEEIAIADLAELVAEATGFAGSFAWDRRRPDGQPRRSIDTSRAARFGFEARTSLREGLEQTVRWYREHSAALAA
jgi:GDP-L-fucose synthase